MHEQPNRNLLATQTIMNLTKLKPIAADIQLAQNAELVDNGGLVTVFHDHLNLYENMDSNASDNDNHSRCVARQVNFQTRIAGLLHDS